MGINKTMAQIRMRFDGFTQKPFRWKTLWMVQISRGNASMNLRSLDGLFTKTKAERH
jgi:hypothetical protein